MTCADCCAGTIFILLTLATIGIATLGTIAVFVVVQVKKLYHVSEAFHIGLIIALVVVCLIFLFAIYASCCGEKVARGILGILFLLILVLFVVFAAFLALYHDEIGNHLKFVWDGDAKHQPAKDSLEESFNCCGFDRAHWTCGTKPPCLEKINEFIASAWKIIVAGASVMAALLLIGTIVACCYACQRESTIQGIDFRHYGKF
jgi:amino acid transporter